MKPRQNLQNELELYMRSHNVIPHVYFQPPQSVKLVYPCIIYKRESGYTLFGDNAPYKFDMRYEVLVIDKDPDSRLAVDFAQNFPMTRFNRHYCTDGLNHDSFTLYY